MTSSGAVERVKPGHLEVAANVRKDVQLTKEFVASVKQHGVLVPIVVQEGLDGYAVIDGQRRTLAAVEAGIDEVPVVVIDPLVKPTDRIVNQLVINDQRAALTQADEVAAVQELALFGMSATAIAKKIGAKKAHVDVVLKVGSSEAASAAMREQAITFDAAATIAEFDDDSEAQADLVEKAAQGYHLHHAAQQWRDRRMEEKLAAEIEASDGVLLIKRPAYDAFDPIDVDSLWLDEKRTKPVSDLSHDELVKLAGDGLCGYPTSRWSENGNGREWGVAYAIKGWQELGLHTYTWKTAGSTQALTPEQVEQQKAERRQARENTKAWTSATAVRIRFLQELLQRKTLPKGWEQLVARHVVVDHYNGTAPGQWKVASTLLQLEQIEGDYSHRQPLQRFLEADPTKAGHVAFAAALGGVEGGHEFDRKGWSHPTAKAYLELLAGWGYELSDIEQQVVQAK